ncbi:MAG: helix-turn-helix transcriptional regulator [Gammaproteobacteria bacterium]|nr:helix-turn-helix transcriptional regulator [Gammaproteobacteria bacterium]MCP5458378.1 helix-turn-helix transcriptional regulator [Gammaproteobacteria bacterium]
MSFSGATPSDQSCVGVDEIGQYIQQIGERIRGIRARRGMIRKHLAKHSGISERYLAQAEAGKANISIALLYRIAQALEVKLINLLPDGEAADSTAPLLALVRNLSPKDRDSAYELLQTRFTKAQSQIHGVALIGLRGAGKTRLGSLLADDCKVPFVRLGDVIQKLAGMSIGELFSLGGQKAYRRIEMQALEHVMENYPASVIEAGGSLVSEPNTFNALRNSYYTIWLKATPEEHMNRTLAQGDLRPMEGNKYALEDLKLILKEREPDYQLADYILDTSGRKVVECLLELIAQCEPYLVKKG